MSAEGSARTHVLSNDSTLEPVYAPPPDGKQLTIDDSNIEPVSRPFSPVALGLTATVWLVVSILVVSYWVAGSADFSFELIAVALLITPAGLVLAFLAARPLSLRVALRSLKLGPWFVIGFTFTYGIATLAWFYPVKGQAEIVDIRLISPAVGIALLGTAALVAGYRAAPRLLISSFSRFDGMLRGPSPVSISALAPAALWAIALTSTIVFNTVGQSAADQLESSDSIGQVLTVGMNFGLFATLLAAYRFGELRNFQRGLLMAAVLVSQIGFGLQSSSKQAVWIQLFAAAFGYMMQRRVRLVPVVIVALLAIFFVAPFQSAYRNSGESYYSSSGSSGILFEPEKFAEAAIEANRLDTVEELLKRTSRAGDIAAILQKTPSLVEYQPATELLAAPFVAMIPRSVWPEKPVLDQGRQMSLVYYELPPSLYTASAMTPVGDLWRHGGFVPVVLGMAALGLFLRMVDARDFRARGDPRALFLPMLLFAAVVKAEASYVEIVAGIVSMIFTAALASRIVTGLSDGSEPSGPAAEVGK